MRVSKVVRALVLGVVLVGNGSRSDAAVLSLQDSVTGTAGSVVDFVGTFTNDGPGLLFVSGDSVSASPVLTVDDSPFLLNIPPSLAPGASVGPVLMLRVNISPAAVPGTYTGTLTALGGSFPGALNVLDDETFEVIVRSTTPLPVPEPATWLLGAIGSTALAIRRRRR